MEYSTPVGGIATLLVSVLLARIQNTDDCKARVFVSVVCV